MVKIRATLGFGNIIYDIYALNKKTKYYIIYNMR